ncbi:MAG: hypothetical protein A2Z83_00375 [Omnitrophica bacterium GWA2_52_8]|nr:MAG: hypothetical protein A2Z83_00375 [Omnitrophica bacterium GWA2_52_8]
MRSRDILASKGSKVWCVRENATIHNALEMLTSRKIGALVVLDKKDRVCGIISERDILHACHADRKNFDRLPVKDVMSRPVQTVKSDDSIDYLMEVMTNKRVRHLPVVDDGKLQGIVSIGDVVKARLNELTDENKQLTDYMFFQ